MDTFEWQSKTGTDGGPAVPEWTMADRLRKARESAGLEQRELAADIGVSRNTVHNYERGRVVPRRPVVLAWAIRTGVPVSWLWDGADDDAPREVAPPSTPWQVLGGAVSL